jgi:hypothetical protein
LPLISDQPLVPPTTAYFAELNRNRPEPSVITGARFSITPQVHAFDDATLVENLAAQQDAVESARAFLGDKPVHISPVTFRMRGEPDPREQTPFGAAWTLISIKYLAQGGAASISYGYQSDAFRHIAGFPEVVVSESSHPLEFDGLVLRKNGHTRILLASFSPEPLTVEVAARSIALAPYAIVKLEDS